MTEIIKGYLWTHSCVIRVFCNCEIRLKSLIIRLCLTTAFFTLAQKNILNIVWGRRWGQALRRSITWNRGSRITYHICIHSFQSCCCNNDHLLYLFFLKICMAKHFTMFPSILQITRYRIANNMTTIIHKCVSQT